MGANKLVNNRIVACKLGFLSDITWFSNKVVSVWGLFTWYLLIQILFLNYRIKTNLEKIAKASFLCNKGRRK